MLKAAYLSAPHVQDFIAWVSNNLCNSTFAHSYINRKSKKAWSCSSLCDAYHKYHWPATPTPLVRAHSSVTAGTTFATNAAILSVLQAELNTGLSANNLKQVTDAAVDVMTWGGVRLGNVSWLLRPSTQKELLDILQTTRTALNSGDTGHPPLTASSLRFNAGMSKIYSLICDDFIIYDSRVGAALGWMVVKFCTSHHLHAVPAELNFPWSPAKESAHALNPKQRNPSTTLLQFQRLKSGPHHAEWNLKASWILDAILKHPTTAACTTACFHALAPNQHLRALEAALFMIGYDLGGTASHGTVPVTSTASSTTKAHSMGAASFFNWIDASTISNNVAFRYRVTPAAIETQEQDAAGNWVTGPIFTAAIIDATLANLRKQFPSGASFPLSNSATAVRAGTATPGIGTAYFAATGKSGNPPDTSKLAVILEDLGAIIPVDPSKFRGRRWTIPATYITSIVPMLSTYLAYEDEL
ncbi:hypothetical protein [Brachymonas sp. M4Q-1]|uniref:hypothetical protein n=1 Tax=Brachymonas sp. M4Q-1 TaxID=3416906 RepID=UPI003CEF6B0D